MCKPRVLIVTPLGCLSWFARDRKIHHLHYTRDATVNPVVPSRSKVAPGGQPCFIR